MQNRRRTTDGGTGALVRDRRPLEAALGSDVVEELTSAGFAHVPGVVGPDERSRLLDEAARTAERFLALPDRVNGVQQRADQLSLRVGDPGHPAVDRLARSVCAALARWPARSGAARYAPTEARFMRYTGGQAGLGGHRDGKCYRLVVCVFSLAGTAPFTVLDEADGPTTEVLVEPGDLVLLRAPGLWGHPDGRRRHAVGPPLDGERISLTLRMVGATSVARPGWSVPA